ncbi:DHH family phosphoesterase [Patescibacteria group bacterium]|nr:DHH family phosphoesterase [Patescibacteria group bacterium]
MKSYRLRERLHDELIFDLLYSRGIEGEQDIKNFLEPDFVRDSGDPFLLPDMGVAVERLLSAKKNGEQVAVWSDYDCDGIPGGVMLTEFLRAVGFTARHYIPHRHTEGYGLNEDGLAELAQTGVKVIITIDLGTTEHESISYANKKGIDVIVTDHHQVSPTSYATPETEPPAKRVIGSGAAYDVGNLPPALAVINPKRADSAYPFNGLCGAGVAWKLVQAILSKMREGGQPFDYAEGKEKWLLDLVGLATLSDMVPLVGENRMLAHFGLTVMRRNRRPGFAALLKLLRIKSHTLTEDDIGFMVAPRINAASRMDSPEAAARLLATEDPAEARELGEALEALNNQRKGLVAATVKEANHRLAQTSVESPVIVMGSPSWRPGILGLVANSLMGAHGKPVFLWGREGGETLKGSCRSDGALNVVDLMGTAQRALPDGVFEDFGGHHAAGGFSLTQERVHELPTRLAGAYETLRKISSVVEPVVLEREVDLAEVGHAHTALARLAPFGEGNRKPLFIFPRVSLEGVRMFGKAQDHLEIKLSKNGVRVPGVSFFSSQDSFSKKVEAGLTADIVGHIENDWRGGPRVRVTDVI